MNNNLEQNLNDLIVWIKTTAVATQGFVTEQTPLYIKEYLNWYFWESIFFLSMSMIIAGIILGVIIFCHKKIAKIRVEAKNEFIANERTEDYIIARVLSIVFFVLMFIPILSNAHNALKVKIAPRIILVQEFKSLK